MLPAILMAILGGSGCSHSSSGDSCTPGDVEACGSDVGICVPGTRACGAAGQWGECQGGWNPEEERCDGLDNDCDGQTDEDAALCGGECCTLGEICRENQCQPYLGGCTSDDDCQNDSYCYNSECIPYGTGPRGPFDPDCTRLVVAGLFQPALQCEWTAPPAEDLYQGHIQVLGTPTVVDFDFDSDPATLHPSIVFNTYDGLDGDSGSITELDGVLRIIDGHSCVTQFTLGPYLNGSNPVALGDLDGDGRPEIVAHTNVGGLIAYRFNPGTSTFETLWTGHDAGGNPVVFAEASSKWGGPSLIDLDDDGAPEILSGGLVYNSQGLLLDGTLGLGGVFNVGFPVAADVDQDGKVELVNGDGVREFDPVTHAWVVQASSGLTAGYTALADFGSYGADSSQDDRTVLDGTPEVAVVSGGKARIDTLTGRTVFGPVDLPASTGGGPPTIGDFDGDGRAELAAAGSDAMTIFDPDCLGAPAAATCPSLRADGILWSQPSQDHSSNITGSSLFDFEGDGPVEAVYADECFVRVYRGSDGTVLYSQWRSSCTWNENPIVADVDGDISSELVVPSNQSCGTSPQTMGGRNYDTSPSGHPMDPLFAGLPCKEAADCPSSQCDSGFCRCASDAECGGTGGFVCAPPPAGTPGAGNTCRAEWLGQTAGMNGVRVYRDSLDRWVGSRAIWNQHAYAVVNVEDGGTVPRTSVVRKNWQVAGLNNFRQNVQGDLNPEHSPDLTDGAGSYGPGCSGGGLGLHTRVCNRGTNPVGPGAKAGFFDGDPATGGQLLCEAVTTKILNPGECEQISCTWPGATSDAVDVLVIVDYDNQRSECSEKNNRGTIKGACCPPT